MRIAFIGKYPPIQGGVSKENFSAALSLAQQGHEVHVISNPADAPIQNRMRLIHDDMAYLEGTRAGVRIFLHFVVEESSFSPVVGASTHWSRLFGLAHEVLGRHSFDLVYGSYLEPYGLIATILAKHHRVPIVVAHAGSDMERLGDHSNLAKSFQWIGQNADLFLTSKKPSITQRNDMLDVPHSKRRYLTMRSLPHWFNATESHEPFSNLWNELMEGFWQWPFADHVKEVLQNQLRKEPPGNVPVIGMYSKVSPRKGACLLADALDSLAQSGYDFHFVQLIGGKAEDVNAYLAHMVTKPALLAQSTLLPFIAPWRIPAFLEICDVVCAFESGFDVKSHYSNSAREILACGAALLTTGDIRDMTGIPLIPDLTLEPPLTSAMIAQKVSFLLENPQTLSRLKKRCLDISKEFEGRSPPRGGLDHMLGRILDGIGSQSKET